MHGRKHLQPRDRKTSAPQVAPAPALPGCVTTQSNGISLAIKLTPRASRNEIGDIHGAELPIKVTAAPVDSAANEALIELLATKLGCAKSKLSLVRGQTSRHKIVKVFGMRPEELVARWQD